MPEQFTKEELRTRLRAALNELDKVTDEIIVTYLTDDKETGEEKSDLSG